MRKNIYMKMKLPIAKKNKMDSSKGFKCKNVEFQVFKWMKEKDKHGYFSKIQIFFSDLRLLLSIIIWTKKKFIGNSKASQQRHDFFILTINTCCCLMMLLLSSYLMLLVNTVEMKYIEKKMYFFHVIFLFLTLKWNRLFGQKEDVWKKYHDQNKKTDKLYGIFSPCTSFLFIVPLNHHHWWDQ